MVDASAPDLLLDLANGRCLPCRTDDGVVLPTAFVVVALTASDLADFAAVALTELRAASGGSLVALPPFSFAEVCFEFAWIEVGLASVADLPDAAAAAAGPINETLTTLQASSRLTRDNGTKRELQEKVTKGRDNSMDDFR